MPVWAQDKLNARYVILTGHGNCAERTLIHSRWKLQSFYQTVRGHLNRYPSFESNELHPKEYTEALEDANITDENDLARVEYRFFLTGRSLDTGLVNEASLLGTFRSKRIPAMNPSEK